ncbi:MAG: hypothetical protein U9R03_04450 [Candidatus Aerophobetes bacterium]|nr:hypothetical protein [Candidatus Aerophobetes bacterium]
MALVNYKVGSVTADTLTEVAMVADGQRLLVTSIKIFNTGTIGDALVKLKMSGQEIWEDTIIPRETIFMDGQADVIGSLEKIEIISNNPNISILVSGDLA